MKAVVAAFNQEKALVGAFSVITNLRMELFPALVDNARVGNGNFIALLLYGWKYLERYVMFGDLTKLNSDWIFSKVSSALLT